jgi:hypothetical protein
LAFSKSYAFDSLGHLQWDLAGEQWGESIFKNFFEIVNLRFLRFTIFTIVTTLTAVRLSIMYIVYVLVKIKARGYDNHQVPQNNLTGAVSSAPPQLPVPPRDPSPPPPPAACRRPPAWSDCH